MLGNWRTLRSGIHRYQLCLIWKSYTPSNVYVFRTYLEAVSLWYPVSFLRKLNEKIRVYSLENAHANESSSNIVLLRKKEN